ncbi:MAG: hypothetical protein EXR73_05505 [Myxococcales bacterium]|nr:hypothetical protein [Myxococcales bacterium]
MPHRLYVKGTPQPLCELTDAQVASLVGLLEEEDEAQREYYVDADVLDYMEEEGVDAVLITILRQQVTDEEGIEIEWRDERA